ncbi:MAG TPA: penicillin-binding protein 2 [Acidimicrobiales bacterium]|nr:penicillin-binding protein 2 [Acidimicrobiales bacterium]
MTVIVARLVLIQGIDHDRYTALGERQRLRTVALAANRGYILDRNGRDLAVSVARTSVWVNPRDVVDPLAAARALSPVLGQPVPALQAKLTKAGTFAYLGRKLDDATAKAVATLDLPGIYTLPEPARLLPAAGLAAPVLGKVGLDNNGLAGLEQQFDRALVGRPGRLVVERDPAGRRIAQGQKRHEPSQAGDDLVLTLDRGLQYETERLLAAQITSTRAKGGVALVMATGSGEVLSMANLEAAKPGGPVTPSPRNIAVTDVYEPGSVNKLITIAAALEERAVSTSDRLNVPDRMKLGNHVFSDHDPHAPKAWSPADIMRESSNIGSIMIAQRLGRDQLGAYLREFGFGTRTGLGFPGETAGLVRPASSWYSTDMGSIPIGQGVSVTALQMLAAYNTVANGGVYVAPKLVKATVDAAGRERSTAAPITRRVVSPATASAVREMLEEVVKSGTGTLAAIDGYRVGGKTGTARKPAIGGHGYINGAYVSSFAGFVPVDRPAFTAMVMLDEPTPIFGGLVAAPMFADLSRYVLREMRIPPTPVSVTPGSSAVPARPAVDGDLPVATTVVAPSTSVR